jgi:S1-C subfamily serine protease
VSVPQRLRRQLEHPERTAVRIRSTSPDGPARSGGLESGDLILRFDRHPVAGIDDLHRALGAEKIGQQVPVHVWRLGRLVQSTVIPTEPPGE